MFPAAQTTIVLEGSTDKLHRPRVLFSAINGGSGKTFITTGIIAALTARGLKVQPFKKGPDYIDVKWHTLAAARTGYNLDLYLFKDHVMRSFMDKSTGADISIIEGNHGLYDSIDPEGLGSSAALARYTQTPVILIVNCHKMSRSVAALVNGFVNFENDVNIAGVILNQVSGKRHEEKILEAIARHCTVPVFGVVYTSRQVNLEQRHLGIVTTEDKPRAGETVVRLREIAETGIALDKIIEAANQAPPLSTKTAEKVEINIHPGKLDPAITIAVARDPAFNFYYPDNLEALETNGARLIFFSPIADARIPEADGLYLGGGYPEIYAAELEKNQSMKKSIAEFIESGGPVFAECGGMMYLAENITWNEDKHEMVGVISANCVMHKKPRGKGYVELAVLPQVTPPMRSQTSDPGPATLWKLPEQMITRAHEFHYSTLEDLPETTNFVFSMNRGTGIVNNLDGILYKNLLATYTHFHALASPWWAPAFVEACKSYR